MHGSAGSDPAAVVAYVCRSEREICATLIFAGHDCVMTAPSPALLRRSIVDRAMGR
jgi:hypothetical protein